MAASPKRMRSPDLRSGTPTYENDSEGDESSSSTSPSILRELPSSLKRLRRSSDETVITNETSLTFEEIIALMKKEAEWLQSSNYLKESRTDPPFTIKPYDDVTEDWLLREVADFPKASYDRPHRTRNLYTRIPLTSHETDRRLTYKYSKQQAETYRLMKETLNAERFHVCALTGPSGTGKTVFLNQFIEDEEIDLVYVARQHSLLKDGSRKLNVTFTATMTFFSLTQLLFGLDYDECKFYKNILHRIPMERLRSMNLPSKFPLQGQALNQLFGMQISGSVPKQHLVVCIDDFNLINANELFMVKGMLQRLIKARDSGESVILLLCGSRYKIQPIFVPPQTKDDELPEKQADKTVSSYSNEQRLQSKNFDASMELAQSLYEFEHETQEDQQQAYHKFLGGFQSSKQMLFDLRQFFTKEFNVRQIPHEYCIEALRQIPTLHASQPMTWDQLHQDYHQKFADWVSKWDQQFNDSVCYSYLNVEAHHMNLLIAISTWHQCKKFNEQAVKTGNEPLPLQVMPKLIPIQSCDAKDQLCVAAFEKFEEQPYLPLIIGSRYKILSSKNGVFRGEIVTLVYVEYSDFPQPCEQVSALVVISAEGDCIRITPGYFEMSLYLNRSLYGFPLQLAFAKTVRGSIGPTVDSKVYVNLANFSYTEIYTLLAKIPNRRQIQGFAG